MLAHVGLLVAGLGCAKEPRTTVLVDLGEGRGRFTGAPLTLPIGTYTERPMEAPTRRPDHVVVVCGAMAGCDSGHGRTIRVYDTDHTTAAGACEPEPRCTPGQAPGDTWRSGAR